MTSTTGTHTLNTVRGMLIGTAEVVPGISGGTVALITGVYEDLVTSAGHVVTGIKNAAADLVRGRGFGRAAAEFRRADWGVVAAVLAGMVAAVLVAARLVAPVVEANPVHSYAFFFGLVLASLWVPYSSSGRRWRAGHYVVALAVAVVAFLLSGVPPTDVQPTPPVVMGAAAVAVCALVMPGLSGSFILLTFGLYTTTMAALNDRDLGYIATFAAGAVLGLAFFVKLLQWLLERHHHPTMVVMTGLMLGSLRALWPWQDDDRGLLAPGAAAAPAIGLALLGAAAVVAIIAVEHRIKIRSTPPPPTHGRHRASQR
ncbi:putative membrane protein [Murinocardiopsis flavida]|uniref:Putative membrane protein n=1 Tax=Murinocardiopsis flavida TaxID=645275 RepID=A0A2P8DH88_9ACTN|nr:DUF368 domain-containing protein [Murinocardiopsis flavida]PSK96584.1 putative membrane protein [Murinocardiopsis flavida]